MEYKNILFEVADGVATITINRPKALNALNSDVIAELCDAAVKCKTDDAVKAVIITGAGEKSFVAGADIAQMADLRPQQAMEFMEAGIETFRAFETDAPQARHRGGERIRPRRRRGIRHVLRLPVRL